MGSCCFVHLSAIRKLERSSKMRCTFSMSRDAWKEIESRVIPRNLIEVYGRRVFSFEREKPKLEKTLTSVDIPECGGEDVGVMMRKSSRR